ncbi:MAG: hypothetical protein STSR0008_24120 [Ignavibacterium sp.]
MKLKNCKSCGKQIAKNARVCPHCGHKYSRVSGCFAYVLIFFVVSIIMIGYVISNLSSNNTKSPNTKFSSKQLTQKENSEIGQFQTTYRADTKIQNRDGSYIILNFVSIKKHLSYKTNNNRIVNNAIVIENVTDIKVTKNFVKELAYFVLFNENGDEINITNDIWTQTGNEFSEIIIPLNNGTELNNCKFILIGGFDKSSNNGKSKLLFAIN